MRGRGTGRLYLHGDFTKWVTKSLLVERGPQKKASGDASPGQRALGNYITQQGRKGMGEEIEHLKLRLTLSI